MKTQIRQGREEDLPQVAACLKYTVDKARWLFSNQGQGRPMSLLVLVTEEEEVLGLIGYTRSTYRYGATSLTGVIPMSWYISPRYRGLAGPQLLTKTMPLADFGFAIGGSHVAQQTYKIAKLNCCSNTYTYYKLQRPLKYLQSGDDKLVHTLKKAVFCLPSWLKGRTPRVASELIVTDFNGEVPEVNPLAAGVLYQPETTIRIHWLQQTPDVRAMLKSIWLNDRLIGTLILYIAEFNGAKRGRIVHIPYVGNDQNNWLFLLHYCEEILYDEGCSLISVMANNLHFRKALDTAGYRLSHTQNKPLFLRDPEGRLDGLCFEQAHLTYYESDKAYRSI